MSKAEDILEKFKKSFNAPSTKDEKLKVVLICILISTTFWFFNALNKNDYVTRINYPVSIEFDQDQYVATASLPTRIQLEVSGGGWDLMTRFFGFKMNTLKINVEKPDEDAYILTASLRASITPELEPISINYFLQDSLRFKIERKVTRTVVLAYDTAAISTNEDFVRLSEVRINPSNLDLTGPESYLKSLGDTLWLNDEISDVSEDFEGNKDLPELPALVSAETNTVNVSFLVVQLLDVDVSLPIEFRNAPAKWQIMPSQAQVYYKIPETSFDVADTTGVRVYADFREMKEDSTIQLQFRILNEDFRSVRVFPDIIKAIKND